MTFEWDDDKDLVNRKDHKVSFATAKQVFDDPRAIPFEDPDRSDKEDRYVMIGMSAAGLLFVSFTYRNNRIRLISARRANKHMQKIYENKE